MNELHAKAIQATARFIERKGYKVLATQWESPDGATADLVADDDGTICFIDVTAVNRSEGGFADGHTERSAWEIMAASWLASNPPEGDVSVRFDKCDMIVVSNDRALLRYHSNVLSEG